jgi:drug/metabolite transporter (DMT)-like permease
MIPTGHPLFGSVIAVIGAFAYGFNIPAARVAGLGGVNGSNLALQRGLVFVLAIFLFFLIRKQSFKITSSERGKVLAAGICAGCTAIGYLSSLTFIPVGIAVTLFYMFPLLLILMSALTGNEELSSRKLVAFTIAFTGIILCVGPSLEQLDWHGLALASGAAFTCALLFMVTATIRQDSLTLIFWIQLLALPLIFPVAWATGFSPLSAISTSWLAIVISALGFYVGFACQVVAGSKLPPATLGLIFLIEPVVAILTAAVFLGEQMLPIQYLGICLVLGGLAYDSVRTGSPALQSG